jgi:hypothetical protein
MPDFLTNVVTTYLGQRKVIEPRRPARFEPLDTLGVDPVLNVASGLDEVVNVDEGVPDPAEKAVDSAPDASLSQGRSPEQPTPNDHTVPFASSRPQSPLVGDPQTEQPLLDPSFDRQPRQSSLAPPDTTSQPLPDSGTSGSLLPREGGRRVGPSGRPEIDVTGTTTTQPSIRPNHVHPRVIAEPVEPDPLTTGSTISSLICQARWIVQAGRQWMPRSRPRRRRPGRSRSRQDEMRTHNRRPGRSGRRVILMSQRQP